MLVREVQMLPAPLSRAALPLDVESILEQARAHQMQSAAAAAAEAAAYMESLLEPLQQKSAAAKEELHELFETFAADVAAKPGNFAKRMKAKKKAMTKMGNWSLAEEAALVREVQSQLDHGGTMYTRS